MTEVLKEKSIETYILPALIQARSLHRYWMQMFLVAPGSEQCCVH